jgi:GT2 family glycosyltransferase
MQARKGAAIKTMTSSIAVINWNSGDLLRTCLDSLLATTKGAEIAVIDNASTDDSLESAGDFRNRVDFICNSVNRGFAAAVNQAFQMTSSAYMLILNPDVTVLPGAVQLLEEFLNAHPRAGAVGGYVGEKYPPRRFPSPGALILENLGAGSLRLRPGYECTVSHTSKGHRLGHSSAIRVDQPAAAALMIRRDAYDEVEGFDERFFPAWYEDVDFCCRIKEKGWEIFFLPAAEFVHGGGYSAAVLGSERFLGAYYQNQVRYAQKHFGRVSTIAVRISVAAGVIARMIGRPREAGAYGRVLLGALKGW